MCMTDWAKSKPELLRDGLGDDWWAAVGGAVSRSVLLVPAQDGQSDQREGREAPTALRRMFGTGRLVRLNMWTSRTL